jgi:hypothetical protein
MKPIVKEELERLLKRYAGECYVHFEVVPGGFVRNVRAHVAETHVAGESPYRVALKLAEDGWIRMEGLSHWTTDEQGRLILSGHDSQGRITATLLLGKLPFPK